MNRFMLGLGRYILVMGASALLLAIISLAAPMYEPGLKLFPWPSSILMAIAGVCGMVAGAVISNSAQSRVRREQFRQYSERSRPTVSLVSDRSVNLAGKGPTSDAAKRGAISMSSPRRRAS